MGTMEAQAQAEAYRRHEAAVRAWETARAVAYGFAQAAMDEARSVADTLPAGALRRALDRYDAARAEELRAGAAADAAYRAIPPAGATANAAGAVSP